MQQLENRQIIGIRDDSGFGITSELADNAPVVRLTFTAGEDGDPKQQAVTQCFSRTEVRDLIEFLSAVSGQIEAAYTPAEVQAFEMTAASIDSGGVSIGIDDGSGLGALLGALSAASGGAIMLGHEPGTDEATTLSDGPDGNGFAVGETD